MTNEPLNQLIQGMRAGTLDFAAPPEELRGTFDALLATMPAPEGITFSRGELGGVPVLEGHGAWEAAGTLLYFHGGGHVAGSAEGYRGLAANLARATGLRLFSADYRLAPEAPFPAAIEDGVAAYRALLEDGTDATRIALAGDSAGGGLVLAILMKARDEGLPQPAAALLMSPWVDLGCAGASMTGKAAADPSLTPEGLRACAGHYLGAADPAAALAAPLDADLSGLSPLMIQVGSSEILLDDATRLAAAAGAAGTRVRLDVWPEMIHVWQSFSFMLPEGAAAIADAAGFLLAHLDTNGND